MVSSKTWPRVMFVLLTLVLLLPGFTAGTTAQPGEKILRVQQWIYPDVVDPQKSGNTNELAILSLIYEGLTRLDTNQETIPAAAESWEYTDDALGITFHLREGLTYSDGSPLLADNFRYAIERTCDPATAGAYQAILFVITGCAELAGLNLDETGAAREYTPAEHAAATAALGVRTPDDLTLEIDFTAPAPYFHTVASTWVLFPVKQDIVATDPDSWWKSAEHHLGNGPFTVSRIDDGQRWSFTANPRYRLGRPLLDRIEYVYVANPAVALQAYRAGDLDIIGLDAALMEEITADPELATQLLEYPTANTWFLAMSLITPPFDDPKVREAFAYAFDRETYCGELAAGTCVPALSWIPPGVPGAIETDQFAFDPEQARQALAASTYGGAEQLPEIELTYITDNPIDVERAEWVAGQYRDILGVELRFAPMDGMTLVGLSQEAATYPQLFMFSAWYQDYPDPQNWLSVFWTCDSAFATPIGYCNAEFDRLVALGDATIDPAERRQYYEQAGRLLVEDVPGVFVFNGTGLYLVQPNVTGITPTASEGEWPGQYSSLMTMTKT